MADRAAGGADEGRTRADPVVGPRRELVLAVVIGIAVSRLAEGAATWAVAALLVAAVAVGAHTVLSAADVARRGATVPVEALLLPAVTAFATMGVIRLVPVGWALVPALGVAALLLDRTLASEARLALASRPTGEADRIALNVQVVFVAFLAFLAVAVLVPGGLPEPGGASIQLTEGSLLLLVAVDGVLAGVLGYRIVILRVGGRRAAVEAAFTYAGAVAVAAAALRAADVPRLLGPALITLVFFLWDAFSGAPPARRRDRRWLWQVALLAALGLVVVAWNLALR